jgi:transposase InsO family protein
MGRPVCTPSCEQEERDTGASGLRGSCAKPVSSAPPAAAMGPITTRRDKEARPAPDLVDRQFSAPGPNRLWVADITFIPTAAGFLYLAVVLDAWSRKIVGWSMANHLRAELVLDALEMAVGQRRPRDVIHHSDQGTQAIHVVGVRQALQGSRRSALHGLGRRRRSLPSGRRSRTRGTTPCARASSQRSSANCWIASSCVTSRGTHRVLQLHRGIL